MKRAYRRRYHYIYKTTCVITGKYYLGMHSTDDLNDGYVGSGKRLWYSINKHGKENHVCEILEHYFTREWLREREAELVCAETLTDPLCMNLKIGGDGGFEYINEHGLRSIDAAKKAGQAAWIKCKNDPERLKEFISRVSNNMTRLHAENRINGISVNADMRLKGTIAAQTVAAKEKRKDTFSIIGHQQGEKNSQFGSCWIYSLTTQTSKKVPKEQVTSYVLQGWIIGRKMKF